MSVAIESLKGKTLVAISKETRDQNDALVFKFNDDTAFVMGHYQDCCESVYIESITGDLEDLVGDEIVIAEASSSHSCEDYSQTWTFYKLATRKGYVDIRWVGESNGYYSEDVDCWIEHKGERVGLLDREPLNLILTAWRQ